jgi:pSer/pThr/pTyr-binding forkhead associated (FHA) protein
MRYPIRQARTTIGRGTQNALVVEDPSVSERHASLQLAGGVWTLADLGSVNGSWVDGEPVQAPLALASGCSVRLGAVELVFAAHDRWEDSPADTKVDGLPGSPYLLPLPRQGRRVPAPVLIGLGVMLLAALGYLIAGMR